MVSIKKLAIKEIGGYYLIPLDRIRVSELNMNRRTTAEFQTLVDALKLNAFDENKRFVPPPGFDALQGYVEDSEDGLGMAVATEGWRRWNALKQLSNEGYIIEGVPFQRVNVDPSTPKGKAAILAMQIQEDQKKSPLEVAGILKQIEVDCGLTATEVSQLTGRSQSIISRHSTVLVYCEKYPQLAKLVEDEVISLTTAWKIVDRSKKTPALTIEIQIQNVLELAKIRDDETQQPTAEPTTQVDDQSEEETETEPTSKLAGTKKKASANGNSRKGTNKKVSDGALDRKNRQMLGVDKSALEASQLALDELPAKEKALKKDYDSCKDMGWLIVLEMTDTWSEIDGEETDECDAMHIYREMRQKLQHYADQYRDIRFKLDDLKKESEQTQQSLDQESDDLDSDDDETIEDEF